MKKLGAKSLLAAVTILGLSLAGCSGNSDSDGQKSNDTTQSTTDASQAEKDNVADFEWVTFEMPEGWEDAKESTSYVTIRNTADTDMVIKISAASLFSDTPTAADTAAEVKERQGDYYGDGGTQKIGDYEWTLLTFTFDERPSVQAYADINDKKYVQVTIFGEEIDGPDAQTVLSTMKIDPDKL